MTTQKPKLVLYVDEKLKSEYQYIAKAHGVTLNSYVKDVLTELLPQAKQVADAMILFKTDPKKAIKLMNAAASVSKADIDEVIESLEKKPKLRRPRKPKA